MCVCLLVGVSAFLSRSHFNRIICLYVSLCISACDVSLIKYLRIIRSQLLKYCVEVLWWLCLHRKTKHKQNTNHWTSCAFAFAFTFAFRKQNLNVLNYCVKCWCSEMYENHAVHQHNGAEKTENGLKLMSNKLVISKLWTVRIAGHFIYLVGNSNE